MIKLKLNSATGNMKFDYSDMERFYNQYLFGSGDPTQAPDDELAAALAYATKERRKAERNEDYSNLRYYSKIEARLKNAKQVNKEKTAGTYEIKRQIENDIWACIQNTEVDFEALAALRQKYKDNASLFQSIRRRILEKEMWYD